MGPPHSAAVSFNLRANREQGWKYNSFNDIVDHIVVDEGGV